MSLSCLSLSLSALSFFLDFRTTSLSPLFDGDLVAPLEILEGPCPSLYALLRDGMGAVGELMELED